MKSPAWVVQDASHLVVRFFVCADTTYVQVLRIVLDEITLTQLFGTAAC